MPAFYMRFPQTGVHSSMCRDHPILSGMPAAGSRFGDRIKEPRTASLVRGRRGRAKACWRTRELRIDEILAEPIVKALMKADGVEPKEVVTILANVSDMLLNVMPREKDASNSFPRRADADLQRGPSVDADDSIANLKEAYLLGIYDAELAIDELRTSHGLNAIETMHLMRAWDNERLGRMLGASRNERLQRPCP